MSKTKLGSNEQEIKAADAQGVVFQDAGSGVNASQTRPAATGDMGRSFSSRLRELRRNKALSLRKLGREIGVRANAVLRWEKD